MTNFYSEDILNKFRSGSKDAFETIYNNCWEEVYLSALKRVGDEDVAKELTQELFIYIWEKRESLHIRDSIKYYLLTAIKYRVINYFKSAITREKYYSDLLLLMGDQHANPIESFQTIKGIEHTLKTTMSKMPERMRMIFAMNRLEQKTISEISNELNISNQTVKNQLTAASKIVRKFFFLPLFLLVFIYS